MTEDAQGKRIWFIDRRAYWREPFSRALRQVGFDVVATGDYAYPPGIHNAAAPPDLVVLACTTVTPVETELVASVARSHHDVLVVGASLPPEAMRRLFLAGAFDVTDMPVKARDFVHLVRGALADARSTRNHRAAALAGL